MAVQCEHEGRGVLECGKQDRVFLSEERFFDDGFHHGINDEFLFWPPFLTFGGGWFDEEVPVVIGNEVCEFDWEDNEFEC